MGRNFYFSGNVGGFHDVMSYCGVKSWMSDKGYQKMINYKMASAFTGSSTSARYADGRAPANPAQQGLRLAQIDGVWRAHRVTIPVAAVNSVHVQDAGSIHPVLKGLPVKALNTDLGQSRKGPYYVPVSDARLGSMLNTSSTESKSLFGW